MLIVWNSVLDTHSTEYNGYFWASSDNIDNNHNHDNEGANVNKNNDYDRDHDNDDDNDNSRNITNNSCNDQNIDYN